MRFIRLRSPLAVLCAAVLASCAEQPAAPELHLGAAGGPLLERAAETEARISSMLVTGPWSDAPPQVKAFNVLTTEVLQSFFAYPATFQGGVRVAVGDVNGDGYADIISGAGPGAGPHVKVFSGATGEVLRSFLAYGSGFQGGVFVAAGDVNGDGYADIVTGAGAGGGPHVKVFDGMTGTELAGFLVFPADFSGGVTVAAGDIDGDGYADIIVGAGPGAGPHVKVFSGETLDLTRSFFAYDADFQGGVFVAAGDVNGDGFADIVTGAGPGGGPHVKVFSGTDGSALASFFAYTASFSGGVSVAAGDIDGDGRADIVTGAGPGAGPHVKIFSGATSSELRSFFAYDARFSGGVFVAVGDRGERPSSAVDEILSAAREAIDAGTLVGNGGGNASDRLETWLRMLVEADAHIQSGNTAAGCELLEWAYLRADGRIPPPDFVSGADREPIANLVLALLDELGCGVR